MYRRAKLNQNPACQELKKSPKMASEAISEYQIFLEGHVPKGPPKLLHAYARGRVLGRTNSILLPPGLVTSQVERKL